MNSKKCHQMDEKSGSSAKVEHFLHGAGKPGDENTDPEGTWRQITTYRSYNIHLQNSLHCRIIVPSTCLERHLVSNVPGIRRLLDFSGQQLNTVVKPIETCTRPATKASFLVKILALQVLQASAGVLQF